MPCLHYFNNGPLLSNLAAGDVLILLLLVIALGAPQNLVCLADSYLCIQMMMTTTTTTATAAVVITITTNTIPPPLLLVDVKGKTLPAARSQMPLQKVRL